MIFVYGAYGFTGRKIFDILSSEFSQTSPGITKTHFTISGRNKQKLEKLYSTLKNNFKNLTLLSAEPPDLKDMKIRDLKLVVNTAGPFSDFGHHVVEFALLNNANYIDCSGEWVWVENLISNYSGKFQEKKLFLSSGVAWETVSGELSTKKLVQKLQEEKKINSLSRIFLVYLAEFNMSPGTLQSSLNIIKNGSITWENGKVRKVKSGFERFSFELRGRKFLATNISTSDVFNSPLSLGEISKKIKFDVLFATTYEKAKLFFPAIRYLNLILKMPFALSVLKRVADRIPEPDENKNRLASAIAFGLDSNQTEIGRYEIHAKKPYHITSKILAHAICEFLTDKYSKEKFGYQPPTSLFKFNENQIFSE
ncbi:Putative trans-acting enoyl reductase [bacterium HR19]|nr:Putative trans-acting enoyl reductase [bacterium HR19]